MAPVASPSNPYKRHIDAVQRVYSYAKRPKPSHESSASAPGAMPGHHSASATTPTEPSELGSDSDSDSDSESNLSESSEEPSDESDVEESEEGSDDGSHDDSDDEGENTEDAVVNLRANRGERPNYKLPDDEGLEDIRPFLKDFIPKLKAANEELEAQRKAGTLKTSEIVGEDDGNGEEEYIEMNLGLGVLEEKGDNAENEESDTSMGESDSREEVQSQEENIMGKLMGRDKPEAPVGIQEVTDT